jgi:hypothetical protein
MIMLGICENQSEDSNVCMPETDKQGHRKTMVIFKIYILGFFPSQKGRL